MGSLLLFYIGIVRWYEKHKIGEWVLEHRELRIFIAVSLTILSCFSIVHTPKILTNFYGGYLARMYNIHYVCAPINYAFSIYDAINENSRIDLDILQKNIEKATVTSQPSDTLTIVYIIGESHIKHRSGIYGYRLNTNPGLGKLESSGNLITLTDVITHSMRTKDVLCEMLSLHAVDEDTPYDNYPLLPALMKKRHSKYIISIINLFLYPGISILVVITL